MHCIFCHEIQTDQVLIETANFKVVFDIRVAKQFAYEFDGPYARVLTLVVSEQHRRKQIGNKLMDAAEHWATKQGCRIITLNSGNREEREAAHRFYMKIGYIGKSTGFSKKLDSR